MPEHEPRIFSIAFDGPHRVGKGTQINLVAHELEKQGIPYLIVRGDGSRPNEGLHPGDPVSDWWTRMNQELRSLPGQTNLEAWDVAANRLARELLVFRKRILPRIAKQQNAKVAVLLIDRSLISRAIMRADSPQESDVTLYPPITSESGRREKKITPEMVAPDLMFHLVADKDVLMSRLSPDDPKYTFRKRNIEERALRYAEGLALLPPHIRESIIHIDGSSTPEEIHDEIMQKIRPHLFLE